MGDRLPWVRVLAAAAIGAVLLTSAGLCCYLRNPGIRIDFVEEEALLARYLVGFSTPERAPDGMPLAWSTRDASVTIADLDRTIPWVVRLRVTGAQSNRTDDRVIDFSVDRVVA